MLSGKPIGRRLPRRMTGLMTLCVCVALSAGRNWLWYKQPRHCRSARETHHPPSSSLGLSCLHLTARYTSPSDEIDDTSMSCSACHAHVMHVYLHMLLGADMHCIARNVITTNVAPHSKQRILRQTHDAVVGFRGTRMVHMVKYHNLVSQAPSIATARSRGA